MKKAIYLFCILVILLFPSCAASDEHADTTANTQSTAATSNTQNTSPSSGTQNATSPSDTQSTSPSSTSGSQDNTQQLAIFTELFGDMTGWYNAALTCEYATVSQLDLRAFFNLGFPDQTKQPTTEEWAELEGLPGFDRNYDLFRLPSEQMNAVLTEYFGITLNNLDTKCFDDLLYLESTDCYYFMATGVMCVEGFTATEMETTEDGNIQLWYSSNIGISGVITLAAHEDGYIILSNQYT